MYRQRKGYFVRKIKAAKSEAEAVRMLDLAIDEVRREPSKKTCLNCGEHGFREPGEHYCFSKRMYDPVSDDDCDLWIPGDY